MRRTVISLVLTAILLAGLWPSVGIAEEPSELKGLLARLQQELGRLQQPELNGLLARLLQEAQQASEAPGGSIVAGSIIVPPGFYAYTVVSGLKEARGLVQYPYLDSFPCCHYFVEQSLNRVSRYDYPSTVAFATGLSTPTDLVSPGQYGRSPFGNFLYVTESGANKISKIDNTGSVTVFASFTSAPKRMAFSPEPGAFGANLLFVTLADGQIVKVDPTGTVSPCASGLSGPEGLVFGPGGGFFKNVLFVAESTGNRISKVNPDCTVSPFASTGLSGPVGLEISPGGGWGPADTVYVVDAATKVDRVDRSGNVTPFASGFMKADTLRFDTSSDGPYDRLGARYVYVSDATAGTLQSVSVSYPSVFLQLVGCDPCKAGDNFAVSLTVENQSPIALPVEIKTGFRLPDGTPINFSPLLGGNKHFEATLEQGFRFRGLWLSLPIPPIAPGRYCYEAWLGDPEVMRSSPLASDYQCFTVEP